MSAIGQVGPTYSQNVKTLDEYYDRLDNGTLPVMRGIELTADDLVRRAVIQCLMCQLRGVDRIHRDRASDRFPASTSRARSRTWRRSARPAGPLDDQWITVTPLGRYFIRNICMVFDRYLREGRERARYSKVV